MGGIELPERLLHFCTRRNAKQKHVETTEITASPLVFDNAQKQQIESLLNGLTPNQTIWLAGYLTGITQTQTPKASAQVAVASAQSVGVQTTELTIVYGSRTGNGEYVAQRLKAQAEVNGFNVHLHSMADYPLKNLANEKNLLLVVSTHGAGVPPVSAEEFYDFVHSKKAKPFKDTHFSVLALGDKSYVHFCKTGVDLDKRLEELGGKRLFDRADCDVDFHATADTWINGVLAKLAAQNGTAPAANPNAQPQPGTPIRLYNRNNPFEAQVIDKVKLSGRGSAKEVYHYELSLENSGIVFEPGDALGIYPANPQRLVDELVEALELDTSEEIELEDQSVPLGKALLSRFELSGLNPDVLNKYNQLAESKKLQKILDDPKKLEAFVYEYDWVDLARQFPVKTSAQELAKVFQKIQPRLYSIASSLNANPETVHLTISAVRYHNTRYKEGVCSTFLSDRISDDETLWIYPERNPDFRLPKSGDTPIIMVGPGTGVAPFRAFIQEREAKGATGKNWLFFGDRNFTTDFLYQTEWLAWHKAGLLTNLNVAFSRDTEEKVYVQHRMLEHAEELVKWLDEGAHFYVCGDANHMAKDVHNTLIEIVSNVKSLSTEKATAYVKALKKSNRYQTDIY